MKPLLVGDQSNASIFIVWIFLVIPVNSRLFVSLIKCSANSMILVCSSWVFKIDSDLYKKLSFSELKILGECSSDFNNGELPFFS